MPTLPDENARIRLDTVSLEARAAHYDEDLREPFIWLGSYVREDCNRDISVLIDHVARLDLKGKFTIDKSNWSKVLRGLWNRTSAGEPMEHPVIAKAKLLGVIELLRMDTRRREWGGSVGFIHTSTTKMIHNYLTAKWARDTINKFGVVIGETGNQKTASFKWFRTRNNHGACVWLDAPETPSLYKFKTDLAVCYAGAGAAQTSSPKKDQIIFESVNERKMIIVENVQRLWDDDATTDQPVFSFLQKLNETTSCTIILSFTPVFEEKFRAARAKGFLEQFEGRAGGEKTFLRIDPYPPEEDVLDITKAYSLRDAEKHLDYCVEISRQPGRIRILFEVLQKAKIRAEAKKEALTVSHLKYVREED